MSRKKLAVSMAVPPTAPVPTANLTATRPPAPLATPRPAGPAVTPPTPQLKAPAYKPYVPKPAAPVATPPPPKLPPPPAQGDTTSAYRGYIQKLNQQPATAGNSLQQQYADIRRNMVATAPQPSVNRADAGLRGAYNEFVGHRRPDPVHGGYVTTEGPEIGKDPNGHGSAWATTAASVPAFASSVMTLPAQWWFDDYAPIAGATRGLMAGPNDMNGTDIGWNWKTSPLQGYEEGMGRVFSNADAQTTPNLYGSPVYDPMTQTYKPSYADAIANKANFFANDATNGAGPVSKGLAGMLATGLRSSRDLAGATQVGRVLGAAGAPKLLAGTAGGGTALGAVDLADASKGETVADRVLPAAVSAYEKALSPFSVNPVFTGTTELMDRSGAQDKANTYGNYIRDNFAKDDANPVQKFMANTAAGTLEAAPSMVPLLIKKDPKALLQGLKQFGTYSSINGTAGGLQAALTKQPSTPEELAQAAAAKEYITNTPIQQQKNDELTSALVTAQQRRQGKNLPPVPELDQLVAQRTGDTTEQHGSETTQPGWDQSTQQADGYNPQNTIDNFDPFEVLTNGQQVADYATKEPELSAKMVDAAKNTVVTAAATPEGKQELLHAQQFGDLTPTANETAKYNLINEGFDADKIGEWYNKLGGPEKFALWSGVSMTMLGLMHAMNGGGISGVLAALLGLGTAGLTAGQSGLFGDAAQEQSQKVTQPITAGIHSVIGKALENPTIMKTVAPYFDHLSDDNLLSMQEGMRKSTNPETQKSVQSLDMMATATRLPSWLGGGMVGDAAKSTAVNKLVEKGFTPETAKRFVDLWSKPK